MSEKIFEVEHQPGEEVVLRFKVPRPTIIPEAARGHLKTAHKEMLLALRSLLDSAIERTERAETTKTKKRTTIEVQ